MSGNPRKLMPYEDAQAVAGEYAQILIDKLHELMMNDGLNDLGHYGLLPAITFGKLVTAHQLKLIELGAPTLARNNRDHLLQLLESSKDWL